jgi:small conductance mechanosensitive channel
MALDQPLAALEAAAAELRADPAWSQALVDGPRILGVQSLDRTATLVRLQARTAPTRQDEVARELRRRIHVELQKRGIPLTSIHRIELAGASDNAAEAANSLSGTER